MPTKSKTVGPIRIRPHKRSGKLTGKFTLEIPASLTSTRKRKRKLYASRTEAEKIARTLKDRLRLQELGYVEAKPHFSLGLSDAIREWEQHQRVRIATGKLRTASLAASTNRLKPLLAHFGERDIASISRDDIERYQADRVTAGCKPATVNGETATLLQVMRWHAERGRPLSVPTVEKVPETRLSMAVPTQEEVVLLMEHMSERHGVLTQLLAETGLRPGEAYNLPWVHLRLENRAIDIKPFGDWTPKTRSSFRTVPISEELAERIDGLSQSGEYVFPGRDPDRPLSTFRKVLQRASINAKLMRGTQPLIVTPKLLRKAFATWQAERGIHPSILQRQLGHVPGSRMTDAYYVQAGDEMLRKSVVRLPTIDHSNGDGPLAKSGNTDERKEEKGRSISPLRYAQVSVSSRLSGLTVGPTGP